MLELHWIVDNLKPIFTFSFLVTIAGFLYKRHGEITVARGKHRDDIKSWSDEVIRALTRSNSLFIGVKADAGNAEKAKLTSELSALIDIGRTYFPNAEAIGDDEKPEAFRGHRRRILDWLVCTHDLLAVQQNALSADSRHMLRQLCKYFITDRQRAIAAVERHGPVSRWPSRRRRRCETDDFLDANKQHPTLLAAFSLTQREQPTVPLSSDRVTL
ncbi:MAG: hypothetical protein ABI197_06140 [Granulicella sp.]